MSRTAVAATTGLVCFLLLAQVGANAAIDPYDHFRWGQTFDPHHFEVKRSVYEPFIAELEDEGTIDRLAIVFGSSRAMYLDIPNGSGTPYRWFNYAIGSAGVGTSEAIARQVAEQPAMAVVVIDPIAIMREEHHSGLVERSIRWSNELGVDVPPENAVRILFEQLHGVTPTIDSLKALTGAKAVTTFHPNPAGVVPPASNEAVDSDSIPALTEQYFGNHYRNHAAIPTSQQSLVEQSISWFAATPTPTLLVLPPLHPEAVAILDESPSFRAMREQIEGIAATHCTEGLAFRDFTSITTWGGTAADFSDTHHLIDENVDRFARAIADAVDTDACLAQE